MRPPTSHCSRLHPEHVEGPNSGSTGWRRSDRMQAQDVSSGCNLLEKREGSPEREPQVPVSLCWAVSAFRAWPQSFHLMLYLQNSVSLTCYFIFPYLIFMVTNHKEQNHSVTQYNLNCTPCSALHHFPPAICISSLNSIVLCSAGGAESQFLHCLLKVIGFFLDCGTWIDALIHQLISSM